MLRSTSRKHTYLRMRPFSLISITLITTLIVGCPNTDSGSTGGVGVARELENADIVKLVDGFLYVANPFTGLRIVDVRNIDTPLLAGNIELGGRAIELIIRDNLAYIITTADFYDCAGESVGFSSEQFNAEITPNFQGSRLWIVDISDVNSPTIVSQLDINGFARQAARIDDVLYLTGVLTFGDVDFGFDPGVFIDSISIADPAQPTFVDSETFDGEELDIAVTPNSMIVFGPDPTLAQTSFVSFADISDPNGNVEVRSQFRVPGDIPDRSFIHATGNVLFFVTSEFIEDARRRATTIYTYDVSNPDAVERLAQLMLDTSFSPYSARFEGNTAYVSTIPEDEPIAVIDLTVPENPFVSAELPSPGDTPLLFPNGNRLLAFGEEPEFFSPPVVALYDVTTPGEASRLSQFILAGPEDITGRISISVNGLKIVDDGRLALVPMAYFDETENEVVELVSLFSVGDDLTQRGHITHRGLSERAGILDDRLWLLSDLSFQTVNIDDLDNPTSAARLDTLSLNDQELLDSGFSECIASAQDDSVSLLVQAPCGILGFIPIMAMFSGLTVLKLRLRN